MCHYLNCEGNCVAGNVALRELLHEKEVNIVTMTS